MHARTIVILALGLVAAGGVYALTRRTETAGEGVDSPDVPLDNFSSFVDGDWPASVFLDVADSLGGTVMSQQALSWDGLQRLKTEEGFSATPYSDFKGYSIGYGHLIKAGESLTYVTEDQATQLLAADVAWAEQAVRTSVTVPLTVNQFDALVLFVYNIGAPAFRNSTLLRLLNAGDYAGAAAQFPRWVNAGGQVNTTLVARRGREQSLFEA